MTKKKEDGINVYKLIEMDKIDPPLGQVRMNIPQDMIQGLADNIREMGLFNPILLTGSDGRYEIIQGHRRYLAFKLLGRKTIHAKVVEMDGTTVALARASENLQREELTPIEEGAVYQDLTDRFNMSYVEISKKMGKSPNVVKRRLDLMRMPAVLQQAIHEGKISVTVGEELWILKDDAATDYYLSFAIENGATKDVVRQWVRDHQSKVRTAKMAGEKGVPPDSPMEPRPVYVPCDVCREAMEIGTELVIRTCPECGKKIQAAMS